MNQINLITGLLVSASGKETVTATIHVYNSILCPGGGDCKNYPAVGAICKVVDGFGTTVAEGSTDSTGTVSLVLPKDTGAYRVFVTMPGYTMTGSGMAGFAANQNTNTDVFVWAQSPGYTSPKYAPDAGGQYVYVPPTNPPATTSPTTVTPSAPTTQQPTSVTAAPPAGGVGGLPTSNKNTLLLIGGALALLLLTRKG